jgi:hypothetical protein
VATVLIEVGRFSNNGHLNIDEEFDWVMMSGWELELQSRRESLSEPGRSSERAALSPKIFLTTKSGPVCRQRKLGRGSSQSAVISNH